MSNQNHRMYVSHTLPAGAEVYQCDTCGRCVIFQWPGQHNGLRHPRKIVIAAGDPVAIHLLMTPVEDSDPYLAPFVAWCQRHHDDKQASE